MYISNEILYFPIEMAKFNLTDIHTRAPTEFEKEETLGKLEKIIEDLDELQNWLYAESNHSVMVVFQGVDASGKDRTIRRVFGKLNPLGVTACLQTTRAFWAGTRFSMESA